MTENEMIDYINFLLGRTRCYSEKITKEDSVNMYLLRQENVKLRKMLMEYAEIGTVEELQALKEKNVAKKMLHNGENWYRCPSGCEVHKKQFEKDWYCPKCGQKLDWN